jgi:phenylalanyl-tRNA synthetase beta chain
MVPGLDASDEVLAERLTRGGLEVEAVQHFGRGLDAIVVASVVQAVAHPRRDNLRLVTVDLGGRRETVVCGAPNVPAPGGLVCFAPPGAHLDGAGFTVSERSIAGVTSVGMLCSEAELGIGPDADGLLVLPAGAAAPGTPLPAAIPGCVDTIFEIGVTPNRPDALGHIGIARDLAALSGLPFAPPRPDAPAAIASGRIEDLVTVEVRDFDRCPHYGAIAVTDVTIGPSPLWLRVRLFSLGVRPVSNVVDITNLVMLEYGHPTHAFDLDLIKGPRIIVRRALQGEKMRTLDGVDRDLDADDLLICDADRPVALAGVMGGENTEIRASTRRVLFECAYFDARGVRRTARRHGLHSESSHRFERGVDRDDVREALAQCGALATRLAGGAAVAGAIHVQREPWRPATLTLRHRAMKRLLGLDVPMDQARDVLDRLGFAPVDLHDAEDRVLQVTVPSHRPDVTREADLIEEVARVRGLDLIPTELPPIRPQAPRDTLLIEGRARAAAVELGLSEAVTYGFVSQRQLELLGAPAPAVRLLNPLSEDRSVMRTSLLPGLLETAARARRHGVRNARLFTIGARFLPGTTPDGLPHEARSFAALLTGSQEPWLARGAEIDVYDAKGIGLEMVGRVTRREAITGPFEGDAPCHLHPRASARLLCEGRPVGAFGLLHPDVADAFEVAESTVVVELDLGAIGELGVATPVFKPIPRVPAATRDLALVVPDRTEAGDVEKIIRDAAGELCESVELFDVFRGGSVPAGSRSLAFHVVYRDPNATADPEKARTLTDQEVDERHAAVVRTAAEKIDAALR